MAEVNLAVPLDQVFRTEAQTDKVRRSSEALLKQASQDGDNTLRVVGLCKGAQADIMDGTVSAALEKVHAAKALSQEYFLADCTAVVKYQFARIYAKDEGNAESVDQALDLAFQALEAFKQLGLRTAEAASALLLGDIYGILKHQDAVRYHKEALAIFREVGDQSFCGAARHKLAKDFLAKGQYLKAIPAAQKAIASYQAVGSAEEAEQGSCWITLAEAQCQAHEMPKVQESVSQARAIFGGLADVVSEAKAMGILVKSYMQNDSPGEAVGVAKETVTRFREAGDRPGECHALLSLAKLLLPLDPEKAEKIAVVATGLMESLGMREVEECRAVKARCEHAKAASEVEATIWKRKDFLHVPRSLIVDPGGRGRLQNEFAEFAKAA